MGCSDRLFRAPVCVLRVIGIGDQLFLFDLSNPLVTAVTACIIIGSILLAPSIVIGYAVKAAEREDRENGL